MKLVYLCDLCNDASRQVVACLVWEVQSGVNRVVHVHICHQCCHLSFFNYVSST